MKQYDNASKGIFQRLVSNVKSSLASIAFTGKLSDATNDVGFKPVIEVTKPEYDSLPESKLTDGKIYLVDDGSESEHKQIISNGKSYADNNIDIKNKIVTFDSGDDLNPTASVEVPKIAAEHTMKNYLMWISLTVKNVRYLLKMLGTTDISAIGNGTLTGAIGELNTGLEWKRTTSVSGEGLLSLPTADWKECVVTFRLHSKTNATLYCYLINNKIDTRNLVSGYLSQYAINEAGHGGSPRWIWVRFYNHSQNFKMLEANPEDGIVNYSMGVFYR